MVPQSKIGRLNKSRMVQGIYVYVSIQNIGGDSSIGIRLNTGWTVRGSNPGGGEIFRTRPDRPWGLRSLLYSGYRVFFPGVKRPVHGVNHPPSSSAEVKGGIELYLHSPCGPSWLVIGRTLLYFLSIQNTGTQCLMLDRSGWCVECNSSEIQACSDIHLSRNRYT